MSKSVVRLCIVFVAISLCVFLSGCGIHVTPPNVLVLPVGNQVQADATVTLPEGCPLSYADIRISTFYDDATLSEQGIGRVTVGDNGGGVAAALEDLNGNPIAFIFSPAPSENGLITFDSRNIAFGYFVLHPYVLMLDPSDRTEVLNQCALHPSFGELLTLIDNALKYNPLELADASKNPLITEKVCKILEDTLQSFETVSAVRTFQIGSDDDPHIEDLEGGDIQWCNPKMVGYEVAVSRGGQELHRFLLRGKDGLLKSWPPFVPDIYEQPYALGDGEFVVNMDKYGKRALIYNWFKATVNVIGLFADFQLPTSRQLEEISTSQSILDFFDEIVSTPIGEHDFVGDGFDLLSDVVDAMCENDFSLLRDTIHRIWRDSDLRTRPFYGNLGIAKGILKNACVAFKGYDIATTKVPFFWDLITAPMNLQYCIQQYQGVLNIGSEAQGIPPTPSMLIEPSSAEVNQTVTFDATGCTDDLTPSDLLEVRWDFNGDGDWDTDWATRRVEIRYFTAPGVYCVRLAVRDESGLTNSTYSYITVGTGGNLALRFDGQDDCVISSSCDAMNKLPLTIEAWVKPEMRFDQVGGYTRYGAVYPDNAISNDSPSSSGHGFGLNVFPGGSELMVQYHSGNFRTVPGVSFQAGQWYHIAVVYTSGNLKVYVNGVKVDDYSYPQGTPDGTNYIKIGKHNDDSYWGSKRYFSGSIDEVRVWSIVLSQEQIAGRMNRALTGTEEGLVAYWNFDTIGDALQDITGHYSGTVYGQPNWDNVTPF